MSLIFTSSVVTPSTVTLAPNQIEPTSSIIIYGFNQETERQRRSGGSVDGAITSEASEPLTTELNEILLFEPA